MTIAGVVKSLPVTRVQLLKGALPGHYLLVSVILTCYLKAVQ